MQFINWLVLICLIICSIYSFVCGGINMLKKKSKADRISVILAVLLSGAINVYTIVWLITHNFV